MALVQQVLEIVKKRNPNEPEFIQAVTEVLDSIRPVVERNKKYREDRKSTRLNSSHRCISYAVFCLILSPPSSTLFPYTTLFRFIAHHSFHSASRSVTSKNFYGPCSASSRNRQET